MTSNVLMCFCISQSDFKLIILDWYWKETLAKDCFIFKTMSNEQVAALVRAFRWVQCHGGLCRDGQGGAPRWLRRTCVPLKKSLN